MIKFRKMHGLGNDFVVIDARSQPVEVSEAFAQKYATVSSGWAVIRWW